MTISPDQLNDAQARHAVQLLYDKMPGTAWEDDKPSVERINTVVRALQERANTADATLLASLTDDQNQAAQAAVARIVLQQALATPAFAGPAEAAIAGASEGKMMFDPVSGLLIIGILLATSKFEKNADGSVHVELAGGAANILSTLKVPELLEKLPPVLKALPSAVLQKIL